MDYEMVWAIGICVRSVARGGLDDGCGGAAIGNDGVGIDSATNVVGGGCSVSSGIREGGGGCVYVVFVVSSVAVISARYEGHGGGDSCIICFTVFSCAEFLF